VLLRKGGVIVEVLEMEAVARGVVVVVMAGVGTGDLLKGARQLLKMISR